MYPPSGFGYDRAITIFAPNGRLYQVEYSLEAVRRGTLAIGIRTKESSVLVVEKKVSELQEPDSIEKIFIIDEHVGAALSGLTADARVLIDNARIEAQYHRLMYDEPISVELLTKKISDIKQIYTQRAGVRPFGVALLIAGFDEAPQLFLTDPSGSYWSYKAAAIGAGSNDARSILEEKYREDMNREDAIKLAMGILSKVSKSKLSPERIEIAFCEKMDKKFRILSMDEKEDYIKKFVKSSEE
ncbi:MAG: archaeal proteasome endopeptidase complex subunit alpha [Candidatus Odinarchaeota archaeon]|nr:archaeal proteasome endopeptidase complex subunit alpha [Candidatus Odinarchaeota archaeon]